MHEEVVLFPLPCQLLDGSSPSALGVVGGVGVVASYLSGWLASVEVEPLPYFFEHLPLAGSSWQFPQPLEEDLTTAAGNLPLSCWGSQDSCLVCLLILEVVGHTGPYRWDVVTVLSVAGRRFEAGERSLLLKHLAFAEIVDSQGVGGACCPVVAAAAVGMQQVWLPFQAGVLG